MDLRAFEPNRQHPSVTEGDGERDRESVTVLICMYIYIIIYILVEVVEGTIRKI